MHPSAPGATRRQFLAGLAGAAGVVVAGRVLGADPIRAATAAARGGAPGPTLAQPPVVRAADGLLEVVLRAAPVQVPYGSGTRYALAYNATVPGPTLRVRPGDRLVIHLENGLDQPTNLHAHGLHVPPSADDVFTRVEPGAARTYVYDVPAEQPPGLFWYHPHAHPWVAAHVGAGLAGALFVDPPADAPAVAGLGGATERLLVLADPAVGPDAAVLDASATDRMHGREGDTVLVTGAHRPQLDAPAGTLERWRVLNASPSRFYRLALDGHVLVRIGGDQGLLPAPERRRAVLLVPGERADLLVAPSRAGRYQLRALPYDRGHPAGAARASHPDTAATTLLTLRVIGSRTAARVPATLPPIDTTVPAPDTTRLVDLAMAMVASEGHASHGVGDVFTINGKTFDPDRIDVAAPLGTTQEWVLRNATTMDHPIHVHTWPFRVVARSDGVAPDAGWKDTVNVPAGEEVRIRIPFVGRTGRSLYHCHILDHEDLGMMATVDVSP